jgi:hypothetical protein
MTIRHLEYFKAVLEAPPVKDTRTAVQVSIAAEKKGKQ